MGNLSILDARRNSDNDILKEISRRKINLDKTMVVVFNSQYYQGADDLEIMANLSTNSGVYNRVFASVFKYPKIAKLTYPILRNLRKVLLWILAVKPIGNLEP